MMSSAILLPKYVSFMFICAYSCSAAGEKNSVSVRGKEKGAPTSGWHPCLSSIAPSLLFRGDEKTFMNHYMGIRVAPQAKKNSVSVRGKEKGAPTSGAPYHACFFPVDVVRRDYLRTTLMFFTVPSLSVICFTKMPLLLASTMRPCRS